MDCVELQTIHNEMRQDCRVATEAFNKASVRFARKEEIAYEACAHQLASMYNAFEQMGVRVDVVDLNKCAFREKIRREGEVWIA